MADILYEVVSEFRFDVQEAIAKSEMLQSAVGKISDAADNVMGKLTAIPRFLMGNMGVNLSLTGIFGGAIASVENLNSATLQFANILGSNMEFLKGPIGTFNERMLVSKDILEDLAETAQEFSIDEKSFISATKLMGAMLIPKGLGGENFGAAKEMARGLLKSAPILGVDPALVQNDLLRAIEGGAGMDDTVFRRLAAETKAFQNLRSEGVSSGKMKATDSITKFFNTLPAPERVRLLTEGLTQFANDADVVAGTANLLSSQLMKVKNQMFGIKGILQPLGQVIVPRLKMIMTALSDVLEKYVRPAIVRIAGWLEAIVANPARVIATLDQLRKLKEDLNLAVPLAKFSGLAIEFVGLMGVLAALPATTMAATAAMSRFLGTMGLGALAPGLTAAGTAVAAFFTKFNPATIFKSLLGSLGRGVALFFTNFGVFITVIKFVGRLLAIAMRAFLLPLAVFTSVLQVMSRAEGYAKLIDIQAVVDPKNQVMESMERLGVAFMGVIQPIDDLIDAVARLLAPLFAYDTYVSPLVMLFDALAWSLDLVRTGLVVFLGGMQAFAFTIFQIATNTWEAISTIFSNLWSNISKYASEISALFMNLFLVLDSGAAALVASISSLMSDAMSGNFSGAAGRAMDAGGAVWGQRQIANTPYGAPGATSTMMTNWQEGVDWNLLKGSATAYMAGANEVFDRYLNDFSVTGKDEKRTVLNAGTNIGKVEIRQEFRETMEPDRVANSLVKTLMEVAENPRQAKGQSMNAGFFR